MHAVKGRSDRTRRGSVSTSRIWFFARRRAQCEHTRWNQCVVILEPAPRPVWTHLNWAECGRCLCPITYKKLSYRRWTARCYM